MSSVFADTAFYAAILNRRDEYHVRAKELAAQIDDEVVTTEFVLIETANFCTSGHQRAAFLRLVDHLRRGKVDVVAASTALFQSGLELFAARPDKEWSLTDCTSFIVMHERGLYEALTSDKHFEQAGFKALLA